jgi:hypothetical protein
MRLKELQNGTTLEIADITKINRAFECTRLSRDTRLNTAFTLPIGIGLGERELDATELERLETGVRIAIEDDGQDWVECSPFNNYFASSCDLLDVSLSEATEYPVRAWWVFEVLP